MQKYMSSTIKIKPCYMIKGTKDVGDNYVKEMLGSTDDKALALETGEICNNSQFIVLD